MASLSIAELLSDIGASELSPQVHLGDRKFAKLRERLQQQVQETEQEVSSLLSTRAADFEAQNSRTQELTQELVNVRRELEASTSALEHEKQQLRTVYTEYSDSQAEQLKSATLADALDKLVSASNALHETEAALEREDLSQACALLPSSLNQETSWIKDTSQWNALLDWQENVTLQIKHKVASAAGQAVRLDIEKRSLHVVTSSRHSENDYTLSWLIRPKQWPKKHGTIWTGSGLWTRTQNG